MTLVIDALTDSLKSGSDVADRSRGNVVAMDQRGIDHGTRRAPYMRLSLSLGLTA